MGMDELRSEIDALDRQLMRLLASRAELATRIAQAKLELGLPARDPAREAAMADAAARRAPTPLTADVARKAQSAFIDLTRGAAILRSRVPAIPRAITIFGLGLVGGSLARALKYTEADHRLTGVDHVLELARESGLFDNLHEPADYITALREAEVVFLCAPPAENLRLLRAIRPVLPPTAIVTDTGGLKAAIVKEGLERFELERGPWFVGGHPLAGTEGRGFEASATTLFTERPWVLTPHPRQRVEPLQVLRQLIESTGATLQLVTSEEHDRTIAAVSHLPQLASLALALCVSGRHRGMVGPALRDMTRLADSPPALWSDLLHGNRHAVLVELQRLRSYLSDLEMAVAFNEPLDPWFNAAGAARRGFSG